MQRAVVIFGQGRAVLHPVADICIDDSVNILARGLMNMAADEAVHHHRARPTGGHRRRTALFRLIPSIGCWHVP